MGGILRARQTRFYIGNPDWYNSKTNIYLRIYIVLLSKKIFFDAWQPASWVYILFSRCKIIYIAAILNVFVLVGAQGDVWPDAVCSDISALLINADEKSTQAEMDTYERDNLDTYRQSTDKIEYNVYMLPSWLSRKYFGRKSIFFRPNDVPTAASARP